MCLSFNTTDLITSYKSSYTLNPFATKIVSNCWDGYSMNRTPVKISTAEAIQKLNSIQNKDKANETNETKKVSKAKKKMSKLLQKLQKENVIVMTKKHKNSMKLIKANPDLSYLYDTVASKLCALTDQNINLINTVANSLEENLTSDNINSLISNVTKAREQLVKDGQKILSGVVKMGAYSEAMMLVDDDKKKDKYQKAAINIAGSLPDVNNKGLIVSSASNSVENLDDTEREDEKAETSQENTVDNNPFDTNNLFAFQLSSNEHEKIDDISENDNSKTDDLNDEKSEISDNNNSSNQEVQDEKGEKDSEIAQVKKEVEEEIKKQKSGKKVLKDANNEVLESVLFA
jgi:hypothetical protein